MQTLTYRIIYQVTVNDGTVVIIKAAGYGLAGCRAGYLVSWLLSLPSLCQFVLYDLVNLMKICLNDISFFMIPHIPVFGCLAG